MLRLVERVLGEGVLEREDQPVGRVGYSLSIYREWASSAEELIAGEFVVEGHVIAAEELIVDLVGMTVPLVLRLDDGRRLACFIVSADGAIAGADGRGPVP